MDTNKACEMEDGVKSENTHNNTAAEAEVKHTHTQSLVSYCRDSP